VWLLWFWHVRSSSQDNNLWVQIMLVGIHLYWFTLVCRICGMHAIRRQLHTYCCYQSGVPDPDLNARPGH
jgi:hypothetical protein